MSFLKSIFFGSPGEYKINDININFDNAHSVDSAFAKKNLIGKVVELITTNRAVQVSTLGYMHVLLHELSHVYMAKLCDREPTSGGEHCIKIDTSNCRGDSGNYMDTGDCNVYGDPTHTRWTQFILLAGPLGGAGFEAIKLISGIAAATLLPQPIGMALGAFLAAGAAYWIVGEALYACYGGGDYLLLKIFEVTRKMQVACRKELKEKNLNIKDFQAFKQRPDQISFWNLFKRTTPKKIEKCPTAEEIEKHLDIALKEIGEIKPWFDNDSEGWIFSHKNYPDVDCLPCESAEQAIRVYRVSLRHFIFDRLYDKLDPHSKKAILRG